MPISELRLVQSAIPAGGRTLARVAVRVDGGAPIVVDLGPESLTPTGQSVLVPAGSVGEVQIEILDTVPGTDEDVELSPVGLAEVRVGSFTLGERVRLPVDLLRRVGRDLTGHSLDIVLTRLRLYLPGQDRRDDEARLDRRVDLPETRTFALIGVAGPVGDAPTPGPECRDDLLTIDGVPMPVRLAPEGRSLRVEGCHPVELAGRSHQITAAPGSATGINIDRVVLSSGPDGQPAPIAPRGAPATETGAEVTVEHESSSQLDLTVDSDGEPFWLILAQSNSDGWEASADGGVLGDRQLVDGYANGWLVTPDRPGTVSIHLGWTPQRLLWPALAVSVLTLGVAAWILWRTRRRPPPDLAAVPALGWPLPGPALPWAAAWVVVVGVGTFAVATPTVAVLAAALTAVAAVIPRGRLLLVAAAPAALIVSRLDGRPSLAWLAVAALAADLLLAAREQGSGHGSQRCGSEVRARRT